MKYLYILLTIITVVFFGLSAFVDQKLQSYSNFYDQLPTDNAVVFDYYQNYYFDNNVTTYELNSDLTNLTVKLQDNNSFIISLKYFISSNVKLFFDTWDKTTISGVTQVIPPKDCKFLEIKLQYSPNQSYSSLADFNTTALPKNLLPFLCLNTLYEESIEQIH